jgi:hypothetical protein
MAPVEYLPTPQSVHVLAPLLDPVPAVHAAHTVGDEAPTTGDAVPAAQAVQVTASVVYLPAVHGVHAGAVAAEVDPAVQELQIVARADENLPAVHPMQLVAAGV